MRLLKRIAERAAWRHDVKLPLSEVAPSLNVQHFAGGTRFVDRDNPVFEGGSDLAYDYNNLAHQRFIQPTYMRHEPGSFNEPIPTDPAVKLTPAGLDAVIDFNKWWIQKAIEKEPITFLHWVVTVVISLATLGIGWAIGRYVTPAPQPVPVPQTARQDGSASAPGGHEIK